MKNKSHAVTEDAGYPAIEVSTFPNQYFDFV
jgi:hypothetical protein